MAENTEEETTVGRIPEELIGIDCPKCGEKISQDSEVKYNREDNFFVGYNLTCPSCGNEFAWTLYFK